MRLRQPFSEQVPSPANCVDSTDDYMYRTSSSLAEMFFIYVFRLVYAEGINQKTTRYAGAEMKVIQKNHLKWMYNEGVQAKLYIK